MEVLRTIVHGEPRRSAPTNSNSQAPIQDLLRPFIPPPFSVYPHSLPLQTTGLSLSLLSFLPEAPPPILSSATRRPRPLPAASRDAPPPMVAARSPGIRGPTCSPTKTRAPLKSYPPLPRPSSTFPSHGPQASTSSPVDRRGLTPAHSVRAYNAGLPSALLLRAPWPI